MDCSAPRRLPAAQLGGPGLVGCRAGCAGCILGGLALPVLRQRFPDVAQQLVRALEGDAVAAPPCVRAAAAATERLDAAGWDERPHWAACADGAQVPAADGELGLGGPGWQRRAVLALHTSFRERELLPAMAPDAQALFRSQSGQHVGMWLAAIPADAAATLAPDLMHIALRRRLRLPLPLTALHCGGDGAPGCARGGRGGREKGPRWRPRAAASTRDIPSSCGEVRNRSSCSRRRWAAGGARSASASFASSCVSAFRGPLQPCVPRRPRGGQGDGGACSRSPCRGQLPARPWVSGRCRRCRARRRVPLADVLELADFAGPSRLPLR